MYKWQSSMSGELQKEVKDVVEAVKMAWNGSVKINLLDRVRYTFAWKYSKGGF